MSENSLYQAVRENCDISDARDNGIYSICTLVLKLRNLYKWEHGLAPWQEPDSPVLLDWIAAKEEYWETLQGRNFSPIPVNGKTVDPFKLHVVNQYLAKENLAYGAGYGRSMKAVFFIAEVLDNRLVEGCPTLILGHEKARELSSPFAMLQENVIYIRKEPLRFFFWDQIQEMNTSCRVAMQHALACYDLLNRDFTYNRARLIDSFESIIDRELEIFIYHEVGENQKNPLDSGVLKKVIAAFPASALELAARAVKDILADTHEKGLLGHIIAKEKRSSLGFFISFLDGMRKHLCPEITSGAKQFWESNNWSLLEKARLECRRNNEKIAARFNELSRKIDNEPLEELQIWAAENILTPLGLQAPKRKG